MNNPALSTEQIADLLLSDPERGVDQPELRGISIPYEVVGKVLLERSAAITPVARTIQETINQHPTGTIVPELFTGDVDIATA